MRKARMPKLVVILPKEPSWYMGKYLMYSLIKTLGGAIDEYPLWVTLIVMWSRRDFFYETKHTIIIHNIDDGYNSYIMWTNYF